MGLCQAKKTRKKFRFTLFCVDIKKFNRKKLFHSNKKVWEKVSFVGMNKYGSIKWLDGGTVGKNKANCVAIEPLKLSS